MKLRYQRVSYTTSASAGRQMERMLDYLLDASRNAALSASGEWRPPVDVYETHSEIAVLVELAGVNEDEIDVVLFEDVLLVKGERRPALGADEDMTYYEAGVRYGRYRAEIFLPSPVDADGVHARYESGFLSVRLPKPSARRLATVMSDSIDE